MSSWWEKKVLQLIFWAFQSLGFQQCPGHRNRIVRATDKVSSTRMSLTESHTRDHRKEALTFTGCLVLLGVIYLY